MSNDLRRWIWVKVVDKSHIALGSKAFSLMKSASNLLRASSASVPLIGAGCWIKKEGGKK